MKSIATSFIDSYVKKPNTFHNSLRWIIRNIEGLDFDHAFNIFNRMENYNSIPEHGINFFPTTSMPMVSGLTGGYMLEKVIVYSNGNRRIDIDTINLNTPKGEIKLSTLHNRFNSLESINPDSKISQLSTIMIPIMSEQLRIQKPLYPDLIRFYRCFGQHKAIAGFFEDTFNIELRKMFFLGFLLYTYIINEYQNKRSIITFKIEPFIYYIQSVTEISREDVEIFIKNISLTREEYKTKYHELRLDPNGKRYDYSYQERFDRALPRVSYSYPLLKIEDRFILTSLNSYLEFLKMDRFYRMITFEISRDFKSKHVGPAIEQYVKSLANSYKETNLEVNLNVYGNEKYYIESEKKDEPDVILETDDYILYIECKANAFGMKLLKEFDSESFEKTLDAVKISLENINRYHEFHSERLKGKKVYKILVFYEGLENWFEMLTYDVNSYISENDMQLMGIGTLENLFLQKSKSIESILKEFKRHKDEHPYNTTMEMLLEPVNDMLDPNEDFFVQLAEEFGMQIHLLDAKT